MMSKRKSLIIEEVDNGFVLTWEDPSLDVRADRLSRNAVCDRLLGMRDRSNAARRHGCHRCLEPEGTGMSAYALACRSCALGLLRTARDVKAGGNAREVTRLVLNARWYWHRFINELNTERN